MIGGRGGVNGMGGIEWAGGVSNLPTEKSIVKQVCITETIETYR